MMATRSFRFVFGVPVVLGLIWTSAAVGDGPLYPGAQYAAGHAPYSVAIGDLDGDQVPDLAVANGGCDPPPEPVNPDPTDGAIDVPIDTDLLWEGGGPGTCSVIEDFEDGDIAEYTWTTGGGTFDVTSAAAHDGAFGLESEAGSQRDWIFRNDPAVQVAQGDTISYWIQPRWTDPGRVYCGFGASASTTYAFTAAPNTDELQLKHVDMPNGVYTTFASVPQTWTANKWYRTEVEWGAGGNITGRLYDTDGTTLLNTVAGVDNTIVSGGIALRAFEGDGILTSYIDTVEVCPTPTGGLAPAADPVFRTPGVVHGRFVDAPGLNGDVPGDYGAPARVSNWTPSASTSPTMSSDGELVQPPADVVADTDLARNTGAATGAPVGPGVLPLLRSSGLVAVPPLGAGRSDRERSRIASAEASEPGQTQTGLPTVGRYPISAFEHRGGAAIGILMFVGHADTSPGGEVENTINAIAEHFTDFNVTQTTTENPAALAGELVGKDVFLVPEQEDWNATAMGAWGASLAGVLADFVASGGVVIVLDHSGFCDECGGSFLNGAGLMTVGAARYISGSTLRVVVAHPITEGVSPTFTGRSGTNGYDSIAGATVLVVQDGTGDPVVAVNEGVDGGAVLIGFDYYSYNTDMARVVANAVQLGGGTEPCPTTYDVYFGTDNPPPTMICSDISEPTCDPGVLDQCTTYYWQVVAKNPAGETPGPVWSFTTTGCGPCDPPPEPTDPDPEDGAEDVPVDTDLAWGASSSPATPGSLTTTFAGGNGQDGNMFDLTALQTLTITAWDGNFRGNPTDVEVYYVTDHTTFVGKETNPALWTLLGSVSLPSTNPAGTPTSVSIAGLTIVAGETAGIYFTTTGPGLTYTDGPLGVFENADLRFEDRGTGNRYPFGQVFSARVWNGTIYYETGPGGCPTTYDVYFGTEDPPATLICSDISETTCDPGPLDECTIYYWRVCAKNTDHEVCGPVWEFETEDTTPPIFTFTPSDVTFECDGLGNMADIQPWLDSAAAIDACSGVTITHDFTGLSDDCGATGSALVTWTATDDCGLETTHTATVTVVDTAPPSIDTPASDVIVECDGAGNVDQLNAWLDSYGGAEASDACGGLTWSDDFVGLSDDCGATGAATVTFTPTDDCGLSSTTTATFTIADTTPPSFTFAPSDATYECDGLGNMADIQPWLDSAAAFDACGGVTITHDFTGLSDDCGATGSALVTWTATDDCDLETTHTATVTVQDATPPDITCPADVTVTCPEPSDPDATGWATATDICDDDPAYPAVAYSDFEEWPTCLADPVMYDMTRTWAATDECANQSACDQTVSVLKQVRSLIIKQGACPAPLNRNSHGVLPVLLTGDLDFDVHDVILDTVRLSRADCVGGSVAPNDGPPGPKIKFKDLNHPYVGEGPCSCNEDQESDGIVDLSMKFGTDELVEALELESFSPGAIVELVLTGTLLDGCEFMAGDCVRLVPPGTPPGMLSVESNVAGTWIDLSPLDDTLDGGGFADFERSFPQTTVVTLTAEPEAQGRPFVGWLVNGVMQSGSQSSSPSATSYQSPVWNIIEVTIFEDEVVKAVYAESSGPTGDTGIIEQPGPGFFSESAPETGSAGIGSERELGTGSGGT